MGVIKPKQPNPWVWAVTFRRLTEPYSGAAKPILFSGPMVRAILAGLKTQTRRVMRPQPEIYTAAGGWGLTWGEKCGGGADWLAKWCPYGKPGDKLWVRETSYCDHCFSGDYEQTGYDGTEESKRAAEREWRDDGMMLYRADGEFQDQLEDYDRAKWIPPIFMPRWASRITLEVTDVRVQRVQEISEEDARAEGVENNHSRHWPCGDPGYAHNVYRRNYAHLWDAINAKRGYPWSEISA